MPDNNANEITVILWALTVLLLAYTWIPALISGMGWSQFRVEGKNDTIELETEAQDGAYQFWYRQAIAMGYLPLGIYRMRVNYSGHLWRAVHEARVFFSSSKRTYLCIQKQQKPMDVWNTVLFATCFQDEAFLLTNNEFDQSPEDDSFIIQGVASRDLKIVEAKHLVAKEALIAMGKRVEPDLSLETLVKFFETHTTPASRRNSCLQGQKYLLTFGMFHLIMSFMPAYIFGVGHWSIALVNLALGAIFLGSEIIQRRRVGKYLRASFEKPYQDVVRDEQRQ